MTDTIVIPRTEYEAMRTRLEDLEDILAAERARGGTPMPLDWAKRIIEGEHPVRVWREYRGLSLRGLAVRAGIGPSYLSEIERGDKPGSVDAYKALADALETSMDWLVA
jgi:mRNA interferase RelE/StbE